MQKTLLITCAAMLAGFVAYSQADSTEQKKIKFTTGLQFISNQTYAGRTDSLKLPVLVPSLSVTTPAGFYAKLNGYMNLSAGNKGFDGVSIEPGFAISKTHWDIDFSLVKNFISDSSNLIIAPVKTSLEVYVGNRNKIINTFAGSEYLFTSEGNDLIVYAGVSKDLLLTKKDKEPSLHFEPSLSLTGGTQLFYYSYLKNYAGNGKGKGMGGARGRGRNSIPPIVTSQAIQQTVKDAAKNFSLLSVEAEFPFTLSAGNFDLNIDPAWVSPVNLVNKGSAGTQQAKPYTYLTAGLTFNF